MFRTSSKLPSTQGTLSAEFQKLSSYQVNLPLYQLGPALLYLRFQWQQVQWTHWHSTFDELHPSTSDTWSFFQFALKPHYYRRGKTHQSAVYAYSSYLWKQCLAYWQKQSNLLGYSFIPNNHVLVRIQTWRWLMIPPNTWTLKVRSLTNTPVNIFCNSIVSLCIQFWLTLRNCSINDLKSLHSDDTIDTFHKCFHVKCA